MYSSTFPSISRHRPDVFEMDACICRPCYSGPGALTLQVCRFLFSAGLGNIWQPFRRSRKYRYLWIGENKKVAFLFSEQLSS